MGKVNGEIQDYCDAGRRQAEYERESTDGKVPTSEEVQARCLDADLIRLAMLVIERN